MGTCGSLFAAILTIPHPVSSYVVVHNFSRQPNNHLRETQPGLSRARAQRLIWDCPQAHPINLQGSQSSLTPTPTGLGRRLRTYSQPGAFQSAMTKVARNLVNSVARFTIDANDITM